jgi:hypothetical protein
MFFFNNTDPEANQGEKYICLFKENKIIDVMLESGW